MNKRIFFSCLLAILVLNVFGQGEKTVLKILGTCISASQSIGYTVNIKFLVDKNKCDPLVGFISMEEKQFHFEETLQTKGIQFSDFKKSLTKSVTSGHIQEEVFSYDGDSLQIVEIMNTAKHQEIHVTKVNRRFPKKKLEDQDQSAICALEDAIRNAEMIAKELGYANCKLKSIDDYTSEDGWDSFYYSLLKTGLTEEILSNSYYNIIGYFEVY